MDIFDGVRYFFKIIIGYYYLILKTFRRRSTNFEFVVHLTVGGRNYYKKIYTIVEICVSARKYKNCISIFVKILTFKSNQQITHFQE